MSSLDPKDFLKAKLGRLPLVPPQRTLDSDEEDAEEELDTFDPVLSKPLPPSKSRSTAKYQPLSGSAFFDEALCISPSEQDSFFVYYTAPTTGSDPDDPNGTVFVCHHGAGYSGLSFAQFVHEAKSMKPKGLGFLALDARGHGKTSTQDETDLSLSQLSNDLVNVLKELYPDRANAPKLLLIGHSMGGTVVVDACSRIQTEVADILGVVLLDIVEGSAMEALSAMNGLIQARPTSFDSVEDAIQWHISSKTLHNLDSARVSVRPLLRQITLQDDKVVYCWRTDLATTQPYWSGWFTDLSKKFLAARAAKLLVLAGTDRLDTQLTIGQMQGKYQLTVFHDVGHCLQEDAPRRLAALVVEFWKRNDRTDILKSIKKIGQS